MNANNKVPVEASEGKAKRKAYRDLWHQITGALVPEGETADVFEVSGGASGQATDTSPSAPPRGQTALESELAAPDEPPLQVEPKGKAPATIEAIRHALKTNPVTLREAAAAMDPPIELDEAIVPAAHHIPENRRQEAIDTVLRLAMKPRK